MSIIDAYGPRTRDDLSFSSLPISNRLMPVHGPGLEFAPGIDLGAIGPFPNTVGFSHDVSYTEPIIPLTTRATVCEYPLSRHGAGGAGNSLNADCLLFALNLTSIDDVSRVTSLTGLNYLLRENTFVADDTPVARLDLADLELDSRFSSTFITKDQKKQLEEHAKTMVYGDEVAYRAGYREDTHYDVNPLDFGIFYACPADIIRKWSPLGTFRSEQKLGNTGGLLREADLAAVRGTSLGALNISIFIGGRASIPQYVLGNIPSGAQVSLHVAWKRMMHEGKTGYALSLHPHVDSPRDNEIFTTTKWGKPAFTGKNPLTGVEDPTWSIRIGRVVENYNRPSYVSDAILYDPSARMLPKMQLELDISVRPSDV